MCSWFSVSLLVAGLCLAASAPTPDDCEKLVKPLSKDKQNTLLGNWIGIEGYSDHPRIDAFLKTMDSFWMHIGSSSDPNTLDAGQKVSKNGTCTDKSSSLTITSLIFLDNLITNVTFAGGEGTTMEMFPAPCPDCAVLRFTYTALAAKLDRAVSTFYFLRIVGRNSAVRESDLEVFRKQAACLQFSQPAPFSSL